MAESRLGANAFAEQQAVELGLTKIRLYTNAAMSENLRFYPRLGYVAVGRRIDDGFDRVFFSKAPLARSVHGTP